MPVPLEFPWGWNGWNRPYVRAAGDDEEES